MWSLPQPCVKAVLPRTAPWSGEVDTPLWCDSLENRVKPSWRPSWLRQPLWCRTSPTQTYFPGEGTAGNKPYVFVSSPRGDTLPLPRPLTCVTCTCCVFTPCICFTFFVVVKGGISSPPSGDSGLELSAVHPYRLTLHKVITFHSC